MLASFDDSEKRQRAKSPLDFRAKPKFAFLSVVEQTSIKARKKMI